MLHKSFESFSNALNEGKVTYKRKYTENHPAKKMYSSSKVRTKVLEAIGERKISKMAFERILRELNANPRYGYRNRNLFKIEEDTVSLSSRGLRMYKASRINEDYNGWTNWDTWNTNNWLTNDEGTYKQAMKAKNERQLKSFFEEMFGKGHDDIDIRKVNWKEVYDGINESTDVMVNEGAFKTLMMMFEEGASDKEISKEFPQLNTKDIKAMRVQYENTMELVGESVVNEALTPPQNRALVDAIVKQAKVNQVLTVANLRASKLSNGKWYFHSGPRKYKGMQDIETTAEVFGGYNFPELDGEYIRDLDFKITGSDKNPQIKDLKLESKRLEEKLNSRAKSEVLSALGKFVEETGKKDADVTEVVDFIVDETNHKSNDVLDFILALNQGSDLIIFESAPIITESDSSHLITEGTRSQIGMIMPNGRVVAAYCHWDGYPDHVGNMLKKHYTNPKTVRELMSLAHAGISSLDKSIKGGPNHSFADPQRGETVFYGRDRGEDNDMTTVYRDPSDYEANAEQEFAYLYNPKTKQWSYLDNYDKDKEWKVLESNINIPEVIVPVNEKKARYKGMLKVAKTMLKLYQQDMIFSPTNKNFNQAGKNNLYLTLYILLEALTDANFHTERAALEKPLKRYMRFDNMMIDPETSTGLSYKTAQTLGISFALKKSHAQAYGDNVYSKIANAGDWSGPAIAYGVCMYLENYGDTAAGAIAASTVIKDAFKEEFPLPKELL